MHFYEWNIGEYAKKTQHLTNEEDLAYRRALDMYYDTEQPFKSDGLATLSRRLRVSEEALKTILDEFFPDGKNKHAEEKIAAYYSYISKQSLNGKLGGRPKRTQAKPTALPKEPKPLPKEPSAKPSLTTNHELLTTNHEPRTTNQEPDLDSKPPKVKPLTPDKPSPQKKEVDTELQATCKAVWHAYGQAYQDRYGVPPVRNAQINSKVKAFCQRIPTSDSQHVAAWYLSHNAQRYVSGGHVFGLLLLDAEKLRTEWATNRKITSSQARLSDQTEGRGQVWGALIAEAEEREKNGTDKKVA